MSLSRHVRAGYLGTGAIFKNAKRETGSHPDFIGDCEIEGRQYRVCAWIKTDKNGANFLTLGFRQILASDISADEFMGGQ